MIFSAPKNLKSNFNMLYIHIINLVLKETTNTVYNILKEFVFNILLLYTN